jgi:hypothetical protein
MKVEDLLPIDNRGRLRGMIVILKARAQSLVWIFLRLPWKASIYLAGRHVTH